MKKEKQIEEQLERVADLCWLYRSYMSERIEGTADIEADMIVQRHRIEKQYDIQVPDDSEALIAEHDRLTSELSTLRWVRDNKVEWREDGLGDT